MVKICKVCGGDGALPILREPERDDGPIDQVCVECWRASRFLPRPDKPPAYLAPLVREVALIDLRHFPVPIRLDVSGCDHPGAEAAGCDTWVVPGILVHHLTLDAWTMISAGVSVGRGARVLTGRPLYEKIMAKIVDGLKHELAEQFRVDGARPLDPHAPRKFVADPFYLLKP